MSATNLLFYGVTPGLRSLTKTRLEGACEILRAAETDGIPNLLYKDFTFPEKGGGSIQTTVPEIVNGSLPRYFLNATG